MKEKPQVIKDSFLLASSSLFVMMASYVAILVVARLAGVEAFGKFALVVAVIIWVKRLSADSFRHPIIRAAAKGDTEFEKNLIKKQVTLCVFLFALIVSFSETIAGFFRDTSLAVLFAVASIDIITFSLYSTYQARLNARKKYKACSIAGYSYGLGRVVFIAGLFYLFGTISAAFVGIFLASSSGLLAGYLFFRGVDKTSDLAEVKESKSNFLDSMIVMMSIGTLLSADMWMMQLGDWGEFEVGVYGAAHSVMKPFYPMAVSVMWPIIPHIVKHGSLKAALINERSVKTSVALIFLGIGFGSSLCFFFSEQVAQILFGAQYEEAAKYIQVLGPVHFFLSLGLVAVQLDFYTDSAKVSALICLVCAIVYPLLSIYLVSLSSSFAPAVSLGIVGAGMIMAFTARHTLFSRHG